MRHPRKGLAQGGYPDYNIEDLAGAGAEERFPAVSFRHNFRNLPSGRYFAVATHSGLWWQQISMVTAASVSSDL